MRKLPLSKIEIRSLRHPKEPLAFAIAIGGYTGLIAAVLFLSSYLHLAVAGLILLSWLLLCLLGNYLAKSWLLRKSIRMVKESYPNFHQGHLQIEGWLHTTPRTEAYLVPNSHNKKWLLQVIDPSIILIDATILEVDDPMLQQALLEWHIASQLGQKRIEQLRWGWTYPIYRLFLGITFLNLPLLGYRRLTQLSGDNVANIAVVDIQRATMALPTSLRSAQAHMSVLAGLEIDPQLRRRLSNPLSQQFDRRSTLLRRFLNQLAFYQIHFPQDFKHYIDTVQLRPRGALELQFPDSYQNRPLVQLQKMSGAPSASQNLRNQIEISTK